MADLSDMLPIRIPQKAAGKQERYRVDYPLFKMDRYKFVVKIVSWLYKWKTPVRSYIK